MKIDLKWSRWVSRYWTIVVEKLKIYANILAFKST